MWSSTSTPEEPDQTGSEAQDAAERCFLVRLGQRVRAARRQRGLPRKGLALRSRVSERYLAQLEKGKANASIVLLRRIAEAMEVPLETLIAADPHEDPTAARAAERT